MRDHIEWAYLMPEVASHLWGPPIRSTFTEWRWGNRGSRSINLAKGTWYDHQAGEGGGVLDLIMREESTDKAGAIRWLRDNAFIKDIRALAERRLRRQDHGAEAAEEESEREGPDTDDDADDDNGITIERYGKAKRLPVKLLREVGLSDFHYDKLPAIRIPYLDEHGNEAAAKFRLFLKREPRMKWKSGAKPLLYGLWRFKPKRRDPDREAKFKAMAEDKAASQAEKEKALKELEKLTRDAANSECFLVEGESDMHTLSYHGLQGLGLPGISGWNEARDARHFTGIGTIYVVVEPNAEEMIAKWLPNSQIRDQVKLIDFEVDGCKDISALHLKYDDREFLDRLQKAKQRAESWQAINDREREAKRRHDYRECESLARNPNILGELEKALDNLGLVGERHVAKLVYLAVTSRLFKWPKRPVSVVVKGPSSGGKSYTVEVVLRLFPDRAFFARTGFSEKALLYSDEPLQHRFLVIYEMTGMMASEGGSNAIRTLLSENKLVYETVEKTPYGMQARVIEKEGPTGLIVTTTKDALYHEDATRVLELTVSDTADQTAAVMMRLAELDAQTIELAFGKAHALQRWLASGPTQVVFPYARRLAKLIKPVAVRLRRDFKTILILIETHALLHQMNRKRDDKQRIIATLDDYESIRQLMAGVLSAQLETTVPRMVRETVAAVADLLSIGHRAKKRGKRSRSFIDDDHDDDDHHQHGVKIRVLARKLDLDRTTAWRRARVTIEAGYLINLEEGKKRPALLVLGEPLPIDEELLPTVEQLTGKED